MWPRETANKTSITIAAAEYSFVRLFSMMFSSRVSDFKLRYETESTYIDNSRMNHFYVYMYIYI